MRTDMDLEKIRQFLESAGWKRLAVLPAKDGEKPDSVFHLFVNQHLSLMVQELAGGNGPVAWIRVDQEPGGPQIAAVRAFIGQLGSKRETNRSIG